MKRLVCCPKFHASKWDKKTFNWKGRPFIKESIPTFFHIPFPPMIGRKIRKMWTSASQSKKVPSNKSNVLVLFRDPSMFRSEIYISVTGKVKGANNVNLSGKFMSRTYSGGYNKVPRFIKDMNAYLESKGNKKPQNSDYYVHYAYCPKCAKKYNGNAMILFARIS